MAKPTVKSPNLKSSPRRTFLPGVKYSQPHPKSTAMVKVGPSKLGVKPVVKKFTAGNLKSKPAKPKLLGTKKSPAKHPAAPAAPKPVAPKAPPRQPVTPFLKPEQQTALNQYDYNYGQGVSSQQRKVSDSTYNTNNQLQLAQRQRDISTRNANDAMAARGLGFSSIRDAELNDLDASLAVRQDTLNTNLRRLMIDAQAAQDRLAFNYSQTHNLYNIYAMQNAQAQIPSPDPTAPPAPAAPKPPAPPKPPAAKPVNVAKQFVQRTANSGVPWAQQLMKSPWATGKNNTAAGWQAAGYGSGAPKPASTPTTGVKY